ncbi:MAG: hypothetical protein SGPRY_004834 [Prymnesium sp.]
MGVVPLCAAHLDEAAEQLTLSCFHSINIPGTATPTPDWYGGEEVVDQWLEPTAKQLRMQAFRRLLPF